jgi:hypothetical protein
MQIIKRAIQMFITLTLRIYGLNKTLTKQMLKYYLREDRLWSTFLSGKSILCRRSTPQEHLCISSRLLRRERG